MIKEKVTSRAMLVQTMCTFAIATLPVLIGFVFAWPSYTLANFVSNETILSHPMTTVEVSLLGSLPNLGGLLVAPICGFAINNIGRKYTAMLFGVPFALSWAIIACSTNVAVILISVTLSGAGAAGQTVSTVYISEIAQDSIRGFLTSTTVSGYFLGLLFSYVIGGYLSYKQVIYTHLAISVLYIMMIMLLKESPVFLLQKGREEDAAKSIAFYRQVEVTSKEVEIELRKIKLQLDPNIDKILRINNDFELTDLVEKNTEEEAKESNIGEWKFLFTSQSSKNAMAKVLAIMGLTILMGTIVLQVYAEPLFKEAVPSMPSNLCAIILAIDFLVSCALGGVIVDKLGRKTLLIVTSIGSGICTVLLGSQIQLHWAPHWVTAFLIYFYCFIYNMGCGFVPNVLMAEVFLPEVRSLGNSVTIASTWIMNFITLMVFSILVEYLGLGPCFYFFSFVCFVGAFFSLVCLPETKGLSADAIQPLFLKNE